MRAFKKLMAATIATAMAATMATSAFAAELNSNGKMVLSSTETYTAAEGQTTVLVVPAENWKEIDEKWTITDLTDSSILYIDQWEDKTTAQTAISNGLGVKLTEGTLADGDYYVLFGGNTGTAGAFAISAFKCTVSSEPEAPVIKFADINGDGSVTTADVTRLLRHTTGDLLLTYVEGTDDVSIAANDAEILRICNVNGDADVTTADVTRLLRHTTGDLPIDGIDY